MKPKRMISYRHTLINSIGTFLSRITGIVKWTVINPLFGKGLDPFHASFRVINNLRKIVGEGVIANAFIPVFQGRNTEDKEKANLFASNVINIFLIFTVAITALGIIFARSYFPIFVPGFAEGSIELEQSIVLTMIMMPFVIFIFLFAVSMGILNSHRRFTTPAFAPIVFNVVCVGFALVFHGRFGVYSVGIGVAVGSALMFLIELIELFGVGFRYRLYINFRDPALREFFKLFFPTALNMVVLMILSLVFTLFVSFLPSGSFTVIQNSQVLNQAPIGIVGVAIATVMLPLLSKPEVQSSKTDFEKTISEGFFMFFYLIIPFTMFFAVFPDIIVNIAYRDILVWIIGDTGKYTTDLLELNYTITAVYASALPPMGLNLILAKIFYSRKDAKTPLVANIVLLAASTGLYFISRIDSIGATGIGVADSIAAWLTSGYFLIRLRKYVKLRELEKGLFVKVAAITIISGLTALVVYPVYKYLYIPQSNALLLLLYGGLVFLIFAGLYYGVCKIFKMELKR
jgi:putative peptidoglycan lipid II flippase